MLQVPVCCKTCSRRAFFQARGSMTSREISTILPGHGGRGRPPKQHGLSVVASTRLADDRAGWRTLVKARASHTGVL